MLEILGLGFITIATLFFLILWLEDRANRNDEFMSVKDWHNFRNAMDKKEGK
jgi:hypothetical protein